jgi:glutamate synthase domain-containing protein 3
MSGGAAYVLDERGELRLNLNRDGVALRPLEHDYETAVVQRLLRNHIACTDSPWAREVLADWVSYALSFVSVVPKAYEKVVAESLARGVDVRPEPVELERYAADGA